MKISTIAGAALFFASAPALAADNLVVGGDFENVTPGTTFTSGYIYTPGYLYEGSYTITSNANTNHNRFQSLGHGGSGKFFAANASRTPQIAWRQTIQGVTAGQAYYFEAFLTDLSDTGSRPGTQSYVEFFAEQDGVTKSLGAFYVGLPTFDAVTGARLPGWKGVSNVYTSLSDSAVTLSLKNISTVGSGNDFGMDSINFSQTSIVTPGAVLPPVTIVDPTAAVPEPATWALMIGGFGLVGGAMRRRSRSVAYA